MFRTLINIPYLIPATYYVVQATNADCNSDKLDKFLENSGIDFKEIEVDCL